MTRARDLADSADKDISGTVTLDDIVLSNDMSVADNGKVIFGAGSDLQIYHDGSNSFISDQGTGHIKILANDFRVVNAANTEQMITANQDGAVTLYNDSVAVLATNSTGIGVTGHIDVNTSGNRAKLGYDSNNVYIGSTSGTGEIHFKNNISSTDAPHSSGDTKMVITDNGVGIGTNSPSSWGNGQNQLVVGDGTGDNGITIYSQNNANSNLRFSDGTSGSEQYRGRVEYDHVNDKLYLGAGGITPFVIDSSGNVGSGAVPETWSLGKALHIGNPENCFWAEGDYAFHMVQNGYYNSGWKYTHTDEASIYTQGDGKHIWFTAASGSADSTLTWSEVMRIESGDVGIGTASPTGLLHLNRASNAPQLRITGSSGTIDFYSYSDGALYINNTAGTTLGLLANRDAYFNRNVGIGDSSPSSQYEKNLQINTTSSGGGAALHITDGTSGNTNSDGFHLVLATGTPYLWNRENTSMVFGTNNTERMRIDASGNFLVGTTSYNAGIGVSGFRYNTGNAGWAEFVRTTADGTASVYISRSNDGRVLSFYRNNGGLTQVGTVTVTSSATSYNTSSDYRLKENVDYTWDATTRIKQLKPARFNFIGDADTIVDGFLAHEVSSIVPEAITGTKDAVKADGKPEYQGIDQSKLVPLLVKTIQELEARITALEG